jgi:hypothetical protein
MVAKEDKDGQIALLKDALEKIRIEIKYINSNIWIPEEDRISLYEKIDHLAETALLDTTF